MKIVLSVPTLNHNGAERVVSILANSFVQMDHEVEILLYYDVPIWYDLDSKVKVVISRREEPRGDLLHQLQWRRRYIKQASPDVVFSFLAPNNMMNIVNFFGLKTTLIVADRNDPRRVPVRGVQRLLRNILYNFAHGVVLQSENNLKYFSRIVQRKGTVIFNPVNLGENLGVALQCEKKKKIVSVGRLIRQKNPLMLLDAFHMIYEAFPDYTLTYYGEGDYMERIREQAIRYGISDKVLLPGPQKNIPDHIMDAEIFAMTSEYEGMPNALLEAMGLGLAVVCTKVSGAIDIIEDHANGILVECGNASQLAEALTFFLTNKESRQSCAENAVDVVADLKNDKISRQWLDFAKSIQKR